MNKLEYIGPSNDEIEKFVESMLDEREFHSRDGSFRLITSRHAPACHVTFEFPGEFVKIMPSNITTEDDRDIEMDFGEVVLPKGVIKVKSNSNVEHQSLLPDDDKLDAMFYYGIGMTFENNLPSAHFVITHKKPEKEVVDYEVNGHVMRVYYIYVSPEKISKKLNTLKDIISTKKELTEEEAMIFPYIAIFVELDAKVIMEELSELFARVPDLVNREKYHIFQVLKKMIKYHFKDDRNKAKELLVMITKTLTYDQFQELSDYDKVLYEKDLADQKIAEKDAIIEQQKEELDKQKARIEELEKGYKNTF